MDANPTLDQLQVFLTVADTGSFSAAARQLNRAQSVVSYTIGNLESQLGVTLFERTGTRQPRLTDEGRAMLTDARRIVGDLQVMRAKVRSNQKLGREDMSGWQQILHAHGWGAPSWPKACCSVWKPPLSTRTKRLS